MKIGGVKGGKIAAVCLAELREEALNLPLCIAKIQGGTISYFGGKFL